MCIVSRPRDLEVRCYHSITLPILMILQSCISQLQLLPPGTMSPHTPERRKVLNVCVPGYLLKSQDVEFLPFKSFNSLRTMDSFYATGSKLYFSGTIKHFPFLLKLDLSRNSCHCVPECHTHSFCYTLPHRVPSVLTVCLVHGPAAIKYKVCLKYECFPFLAFYGSCNSHRHLIIWGFVWGSLRFFTPERLRAQTFFQIPTGPNIVLGLKQMAYKYLLN